jgi:phosphoribosylaminoimidazole (AIR) synthetase
MGIGMLAVTSQPSRVMATLAQRCVPAWECGTVRARTDADSGDAEAKGGSGGTVALTD